MFDFLLQLFGLVLLFTAVGFGYRRWIRPHEVAGLQGRGLLLLVVLTLMGGLIGSPFWWLVDARSFPWPLPPLAGRMLASAGWSFAVVCLLALQQPTYRRLRLVLIMLIVYLAPLAVAILLFHLDRFDAGAAITYAFFAIVGLMLLGTMWYLLRQPLIVADTARDRTPAAPGLQRWLAVLMLVTGLWGMALFITAAGPSSLIWAWPGDPASSRLVGVMLLTIAAGALYSRRYADTARLMLAVATTYGLGLALASLWNVLVGRPLPVAYLIVFGLMGLVSAVLLVTQRGQRLEVMV